MNPLKLFRACFARLVLYGLAILSPAIAATVSTAQQVRAVQLRAVDGSAVIKGDLVDVIDEFYVIKTALGTIRIGIDDATCEGEYCPGLEQATEDFSIIGSIGDAEQLVPNLVTAYAEAAGAGYRIEETAIGALGISILDGEKKARRQATVASRSDASDVSGTLLAGQTDGKPGRSADLRLFAEQGLLDIENRNQLLLGLDGVAVITHPSNPVNNLSLRAIAEYFACSRTEWQSLGGPSGPVRIYAGDPQSAASDTFEKLVLKRFDLELCDTASRISSEGKLAEEVANDPNAIGFISLDQPHRAQTVAINECELRQSPSIFNVKTGEYPIARRILLEASSLIGSSAATKTFVDFALSDDGQGQVEKAGLIGLNVDTTRGYSVDYRLAKIEAAARVVKDTLLINRLVEATENAVRLSTTFRFQSGIVALGESNALDSSAQQDLLRLARHMKKAGNRDAELLLFGFADASGDYALNLALSQLRAQSIAEKLASLGVETSIVVGFGEEAPIACNSTAEGRALNRRVEAWLRS